MQHSSLPCLSAPHHHFVRVYHEDTDFSGVVYHASYLRFMERARTEFIRSLSLYQSTLYQPHIESSLTFVVRKMQIEFFKPAVMDDYLDVETIPYAWGGAWIDLHQKIKLQESVLVTAHVRIVTISQARKACRLPPLLKNYLETHFSLSKNQSENI